VRARVRAGVQKSARALKKEDRGYLSTGMCHRPKKLTSGWRKLVKFIIFYS